MNRLRPLSWAILLLCAVLLAWQWMHRPTPRQSAEQPPQDSASAEEPAAARTRAKSTRPTALRAPGPDEPVAPNAVSTVPAQAAAPTASIEVPETPESSSLPGETVLQNLRISFRQYASAFGENPVGTNPEITSALQGENPKHINFLRADGNRVNGKGELVDVWGTPYFFHQLSAHDMEIRSAGPDRVMYTGDDLLTR